MISQFDGTCQKEEDPLEQKTARESVNSEESYSEIISQPGIIVIAWSMEVPTLESLG